MDSRNHDNSEQNEKLKILEAKLKASSNTNHCSNDVNKRLNNDKNCYSLYLDWLKVFVSHNQK